MLLNGCVRKSSLNPDWEHTYDKRTYNHYIRQGKLPQDAKEVLARSLHDYCITMALDTYLKPYDKQQVVGVMGGHNLKRTEPVYRQIVDLSKQLTEQGRLMVTGGGPGAMQATHVGAWMAGRTTAEVDEAMRILQQAPDFQSDEWLSTGFEVMRRFPQEQGYRSLGIPTWFYGHEPASPFATDIAKYFDPKTLNSGALNAESEFGMGEAVFYQNGDWEYANLTNPDNGYTVTAEFLFGLGNPNTGTVRVGTFIQPTITLSNDGTSTTSGAVAYVQSVSDSEATSSITSGKAVSAGAHEHSIDKRPAQQA